MPALAELTACEQRVRGEMMTTQEKNANEVMIMVLTALHKLYQTDVSQKGSKRPKD